MGAPDSLPHRPLRNIQDLADIDVADLGSLRNSVNTGWLAGPNRFATEAAAVMQSRVAPLARGGRPEIAGRPKTDEQDGGD